MFILGSLDPGRDGVGDYTRSLAAECFTRGIKCYLVSIRELSFSSDLIAQKENGVEIYRSSVLEDAAGVSNLKELINELSPDWISLQFVPYSFDVKGVVKNLIDFMYHLSLKSNLHIMFHEIWIGIHREASWKNKIWGIYQKHYIKKLLKKICPLVINTSNELYRNVLEDEGFNVEVLSIFSNIPLISHFEKKSFFDLLSPFKLNISQENRSDYWVFGHFGTIHPEWDPCEFMDTLIFEAQMHEKNLLFMSFGNQGAGSSIWKSMKANSNGNYQCVSLGQLHGDDVSLVLSSIDYALSSSVYDTAYKSGAVMSCLEHGVPVLFSRFGSDLILDLEKNPNHDLLCKMTLKVLGDLDSFSRQDPVCMRPQICDAFLTSLNLLDLCVTK